MEATQMSIDRWMDKEDMGHMYNGMLFSRKKNKIMPFVCRNMDGPRDDHTKWSKSERERQIPYDITYMWNLWHKWMYLQNRRKKITCDSKHDPVGLASTDWSHSQTTLSLPNFWCWRQGSCSQVDSPVPQTVTLPLVAEAENGKPLQSFRFWSPRSTPSDGSRRLPELSISEVTQRNLFPNQEGCFPRERGEQ